MPSKKKINRPKTPLSPQSEMEMIWRHNLSEKTLSDRADQIQAIPEAPTLWSVASTDENMPYFEHAFVRNRYFYTLPNWLCRALERGEFSDKVDQEKIDIERRLSQWTAKTNHVAVHNGHLYNDPYLKIESPVSFRSEESTPDDQSNSTPPNTARLDNVARIRNEMAKRPFVQALRGYQGWLMSNPQFLEELDHLLLEHEPAIEEHQFDAQAWYIRLQVDSMRNQDTVPVELPQSLSYFQAFLSRWRLARLAGPSYPIPLGPLASGVMVKAMFDQLQSSGGFFFLPDIIPIPSRDELRSLITGALSTEEDTQHLADWRQLIDSSKPNKTAIDQYARRFQVQHCWRLLHERHPDVFSGNRGKLQDLLANALDTGVNSIKEDFRAFKRSLGDKWEERGFQPPPHISDGMSSAISRYSGS